MNGGVLVNCCLWKRVGIVDNFVEESVSVELEDSGISIGHSEIRR